MKWIALIWKETIALIPLWLVFFALVLSSFVVMLFDSSAIEPLSQRFQTQDGVLLVFIIAFMAGHGRIGPEFQQQQIEFLDALPTTRAQVYVAKAAAAALPCIAGILTSLACDLCFAFVAPGPPGATVYPSIFASHALLTAGMFTGLSFGLLLSWLGGLAWGVLLSGFGLFFAIALVAPGYRAYGLFGGSYGSLEFFQGQPTHPIAPLIFWAVLGVISVVISGLLFLGPGERLTKRGSWATGGIRLVTTGCFSVAVLTLALFFTFAMVIQASDFFSWIQVEQQGPIRVLYRSGEEAAVREVGDIAALSEQVGAIVGHPEPLWIDVEFLGAQDNHLGVFTGGKVRVVQNADRNTVAHELAHAHAFAVSGPNAWAQSPHTRFFDEGLASWVAGRALGTEEQVPQTAVLNHAVDPVEFDLLVEDTRFQKERDMAAAYPIGVVFVEALDQIGGLEARTCVLQQIGAAGSQPIAGLALWVGIADACDFDLFEVVKRFEALLDAGLADLPPWPKLEAEVNGMDLEISVQGPEAPLMCRFRGEESVPVDNYVHIKARNSRCRIPIYVLPHQTFEYQLGFEVGDEVVFQRWVTAPTPTGG